MSLPVWSLFFAFSQPCCNFLPVPEPKHHLVVGTDGDMVDGTVPEFFVECYGQGVQLAQFKHHAAKTWAAISISVDSGMALEGQAALPWVL